MLPLCHHGPVTEFITVLLFIIVYDSTSDPPCVSKILCHCNCLFVYTVYTIKSTSVALQSNVLWHLPVLVLIACQSSSCHSRALFSPNVQFTDYSPQYSRESDVQPVHSHTGEDPVQTVSTVSTEGGRSVRYQAAATHQIREVLSSQVTWYRQKSIQE